MQLFVLFGINWTTPFNLKQSDPMAIIEGIQWEITIREYDDWKPIPPGGNCDEAFHL